MSSGEKVLVMNALERALSTDINRLQAFAGAMLNETLRALINTKVGFDDVNAGAQYIPNAVQGNPLAGEVFNGLLFAPTGSSTTAAVGPGVLAIFDPDASPSTDDSQYKLIQDPGTVTPSLNLTANASGQLRIDVIECSRVTPDSVLETDSRDVYVPSAGTFAAVTVNKVAQAQLTYRIRMGTAGAGFPGTAQGWLPLAVASVPTGTTTWDTVTIWDVRPLLEDRLFNMTQSTRDLPRNERCMVNIDASNHASQSRLTGIIEAQFRRRRVGGLMQPSTPQGTGLIGSTADALYVDLDDVANRSAGGGSYSGFNYIYIATPFGLPRWAKYIVGPTGRVPRSPRGILMASSQVPDLVYGNPDAALVLPPCLQDAGNTQTALTTEAVCVLARLGTSASTPKGSLAATGRAHWANRATGVNTGVVALGAATFTLNPGTDFPAHARAIYVALEATSTVGGGTLDSYELGGGAIKIQNGFGDVISITGPLGQPWSAGATTTGAYSNGQTIRLFMTVRIPLPTYYELAGVPGSSFPGAASNYAIVWTPVLNFTGAGTLTFTSSVLTIQGWELGEAD